MVDPSGWVLTVWRNTILGEIWKKSRLENRETFKGKDTFVQNTGRKFDRGGTQNKERGSSLEDGHKYYTPLYPGEKRRFFHPSDLRTQEGLTNCQGHYKRKKKKKKHRGRDAPLREKQIDGEKVDAGWGERCKGVGCHQKQGKHDPHIAVPL